MPDMPDIVNNDEKPSELSPPDSIKEKELEKHISDKLEDNAEWRGHLRYLPLLCFTFCFCIGNLGGMILLPQYVLNRLREEANLTTNMSFYSPCSTKINHETRLKEERVHEKSSEIISQVSFAGGLPSFFTAFLYGAVSDRYGRKFVIFFPFFGLLTSHIVLTLVVTLNLPLILYIAFSFISGLSGSHSTLLAGVFAYTADVTSKQQRNLAISVIEGGIGFAMVIANLIVGLWIRNSGYGDPMIGLTVLVGVSITFLLCVEESRQMTMMSRSMISEIGIYGFLRSAVQIQLRDMRLLLAVSKRRCACLLLLTVLFFLHSFCFLGLTTATTLYLMNSPFCWSSLELGLFTAIQMALWMVGSFTTIVLFRNYLSDISTSVVGIVSFILSSFLRGVAPILASPYCDILMIAGGVFGMTIPVSSIMYRSMASKLVTTDEQGAVSGLIATGEALAILSGPTVMSLMYSKTVSRLEGLIFFFSAAIMTFALSLIIVFWRIVQKLEVYGNLRPE